METKIQKWGNSLALRIPKAFAQNIHLSQNSAVRLEIQDGKLVVTPVVEKVSLDHLLDQITEENIHREVDFGEPQGKNSRISCS